MRALLSFIYPIAKHEHVFLHRHLNYTLNSGSGSGDLWVFVKKSLFGGSKSWVYLYSKFGDPNGNNDGYEEWATVVGHNTPSVPLPASVWGGLSLLGMLGISKLRRRQLA